MPHSSETRWSGIAGDITSISKGLIDVIQQGENLWLELEEVWTFAGGTDQLTADLLFQASPASAEQVAMVADARAAMQAAHQMYEALNNIAVVQSDRAASLRRMS